MTTDNNNSNKNYKIITPDMKDKELSTALFDNNTKSEYESPF